MKTRLGLIHAAADRLNCGVTALGVMARDLDDDGEDASDVATIRWLFDVLRDEVENLRESIRALDTQFEGAEGEGP